MFNTFQYNTGNFGGQIGIEPFPSNLGIVIILQSATELTVDSDITVILNA